MAILIVLRRYVGDFQLGGAAVRVYPNGCNTIQTQEDKVHEVILGERFFLQMGVDQSKAPQAPTPSTTFRQIWNEKRAGAADQYGLDHSIAS